jgi:hypothetical protein
MIFQDVDFNLINNGINKKEINKILLSLCCLLWKSNALEKEFITNNKHELFSFNIIIFIYFFPFTTIFA